jgi:hypothetical protein
MAYFREPSGQEDAYARQFSPPPADEQEEDFYDGYDDGFDEPYEDDDPDGLPELSEEEKADIQKKRAKVLFEAGNITGIIVGTVLVLLLVTILFSMAYFVRSDIMRNFTLFRIQF